MEAITPELIALFIAFLTLLGSQLGGLFLLLARLNEQNKRIDNLNTDMNRRFDTMQSEMNRRFQHVDTQFSDVNKRFDTMNQRFDETTLLIGELRDRTGKLEGTLEGFLAGRRGRDGA